MTTPIVVNGITLVSIAANGSALSSESLPYLAFNPGGGGLAFTTAADPGASLLTPSSTTFVNQNYQDNIYDLNLLNGSLSVISVNNSNAIGEASSFQPVFSPDGRFIAFQSYSTLFASAPGSVPGELYLKDTSVKTFAGSSVNWLTEISVTASGTAANGVCADLTFRGDDKMIAFDSVATNLFTGATSGNSQVYTKVLDLTAAGIHAADTPGAGIVYTATGAIGLVSASASGAVGNGNSSNPVFSHDGTKVAFLSTSTNLVAGSTGNLPQLYIKNLVTGAVTLVESNGVTPNGAALQGYQFSADDSKLVFSSEASNLVANDTNGVADVFVYTLATGAVTRVSVTANGQQTDGPSILPTFASNGNILFQSLASNLVPGGNGAYYDVYAKNLQNGEVGLVSTGLSGARGNGDSGYVIADPTGKYIGFYSEATNLVTNDSNNVGNLYIVPVDQGNLPLIQLSSKTVVSGGHDTQVVTATLAAAQSGAVQFNYSTIDGTAHAGTDYTAASGALTIAAGQISASVSISLASGIAVDGSKSLEIELTSPQGGSFDVGGSSTEVINGTVQIADQVTASAASVSTGHAVSFSLHSTDVAAGSTLSYALSGIAASRVREAETGTVTLDANGNATVTFDLLINNQVNGATPITLNFYNGSTAPLASASATVTDNFTAAGAASLSSISTPIAILDSAANVGTTIDSLQSLAASNKIASITLTDGAIPSLTITAQQAANDGAALADISGYFSVQETVSSTTTSAAGVAAATGNTAVLSGTASQYSVASAGDGINFTLSGNGGTVHMSGMQALKFSDVTLIVAHTPGGLTTATTGNIAELYSAVFAREPDVPGLAYYQKQLQANPTIPVTVFATDFLQSPEYTGNSAHNYAQNTQGDTQFITDTYSNLLHRAPENGAVGYYLNTVIAPFLNGVAAGTAAYTAAELEAHATVLFDFSASQEFLGNVQVTSANPASAAHWLLLI